MFDRLAESFAFSGSPCDRLLSVIFDEHYI